MPCCLLQAVRDVPWYVAAALKVLNPGYSLPMVDQLVWEGDLQGCFESDPRKVKQLFQQHIEEVKKVCKKIFWSVAVLFCL